MRISDRIVAMESGAVLVDGPPEVVRTDQRVVESYLGGSIEAIERSTMREGAFTR
jgi:branched-chain amino acid transport system ATP-binding protein